MRGKGRVPGCILINNGRYWWRVKLPDEKKLRARPLIPTGGRYATNDRDVAEQVAADLYHKAVVKSEGRRGKYTGRIDSLVKAYLAFAKDYYRQSKEPERIRLAVKPLVLKYGRKKAELFGPLDLKKVRQTMIDQRLARRTINQRIGNIKRMFKWAASEQLIPASTYHALTTVDGLRRGRTEARESKRVEAVPEVYVRKTMRFLSRTVAAMVELQMLTGMRSGELCQMRPCDIDTSGKVWLYRPQHHKTAHHGHKRVVPIEPRGQEILEPFLARRLDAYCFSPAEAQAERNAEKRQRRQTKVQPSQVDRSRPDARQLGGRYDSHAYRRAIDYAIKKANKAVEKAAEDKGEEVKQTDLIPYWHPDQLRHTAATVIRREMGLDAARALLSHRSLGITDTYAELDKALAVEAARKLG